jgi:hypothetical protein
MTTVVSESAKTKQVLVSYTRMFFLGVGIVLLALVAARILNRFYPLSSYSIRVFEYLGYIGWCATLGMRMDIQTWNGKSFPEWLNDWLAKILSIIGIFSFVLARELIPASI